MSFNLTQIINKVLNVQPVQDNSFFSTEGQQAISTNENFWSHMGRIGRPRTTNGDKTSFAATTSWLWNWSLAGEAGMLLYPKLVIVSADVDCELGVQIKHGLTGIMGSNVGTYPIFSSFVKAGTPFIVPFDGELYCNDAKGADWPGIFVGVNNAATAGNIYYTIHAMEVAYND